MKYTKCNPICIPQLVNKYCSVACHYFYRLENLNQTANVCYYLIVVRDVSVNKKCRVNERHSISRCVTQSQCKVLAVWCPNLVASVLNSKQYLPLCMCHVISVVYVLMFYIILQILQIIKSAVFVIWQVCYICICTTLTNRFKRKKWNMC